MRKVILAALLVLFFPALVAQQTMNNASVIELVKAKLSDDLIVTTINASPGTYDTSANGIIALKEAGASDKVVSAIVLKASGASAGLGLPAGHLWAEPVIPLSAMPRPVLIRRGFRPGLTALACTTLTRPQARGKNRRSKW